MDNNAHAVAWKPCGGAGKVSSDMGLAAQIILTTACDARASAISSIAALERGLEAAIPGGIRPCGAHGHSYAFLSGSRTCPLSKAKATCKARAGYRAKTRLLMQPHDWRHVDVSAGSAENRAKKVRSLNAIHRRCNSCAPAEANSPQPAAPTTVATRAAAMSSGNGRAVPISAPSRKPALRRASIRAAANGGAHSRSTPASQSRPTPRRRSR